MSQTRALGSIASAALTTVLLLAGAANRAGATPPPWANGYLVLSDGVQQTKTYHFGPAGTLGSSGIDFRFLASPSGLAQGNGNGITVTLEDSGGNVVPSWSGEFWLAGGLYNNATGPPEMPRPLDTFVGTLECSDAASGNADIVPYLNIGTGAPAIIHPTFAGSGRGEFYATFEGAYFVIGGINSVRSTDADGDGDTDGDDMNLMVAAILTQDSNFDLDWNNVVDTSDLAIMRAELQRSVGVGHSYCLDGMGGEHAYDAGTMYHSDGVWPSTPTCFRAGRSGTSHSLSWVAGGDDAASGRAVAYDIRVSTSPITTLTQFNAATQVPGIPVPATAGTAQSLAYAAANTNQLYFAILATDDFPHASGFVATASTPISPDPTAPSSVTNLSAMKSSGSGNVRLQWTAPGDDGSLGTAVQYDLRWSDSPIASGSFALATPIATGCPLPSGYTETLVFSGSECSTYYFALKAKDEAAWSGMSNVPSVTTGCTARSQPVGSEAPTGGALRLTQLPSTGRSLVFEISGGPDLQGDAKISITDVLGRRVHERNISRVAGSTLQVKWALENLRGGPIGPGVYFVRLQVASEVRSLKVLVVH